LFPEDVVSRATASSFTKTVVTHLYRLDDLASLCQICQTLLEPFLLAAWMVSAKSMFFAASAASMTHWAQSRSNSPTAVTIPRRPLLLRACEMCRNLQARLGSNFAVGRHDILKNRRQLFRRS
jgi:hypothetical protein